MEDYIRKAPRFQTAGGAVNGPISARTVVETRVTQSLSSNGAVTIDASSGGLQFIALSANATSSSITNPTTGQVLIVTWGQDGTGSRTYSWPTNCKFASASPPTDGTLNTRTSVTFVYDGTNWNEISRATAVG